MKLSNTFSLKRTVLFVASAVVVSCAMADPVALPQFTFTPGGAGLVGGVVQADDLIIADYSTVKTSNTGFTDTGYLAIQSYLFNGQTVAGTGLNSTYGMFLRFAGAGSTSPGNPVTTPTFGQFTSLNYVLYGYNGAAAVFSVQNDTPTVTLGTNQILVSLGSGSLLPGNNQSSVGSLLQSPSFTSFAGANLAFAPTAAAATFFTNPIPFYNIGISTFINSPSQLSPVAGGFQNGFNITNGGGSLNFASTAVPEPTSIALLGMGLLGFVATRRKSVAKKSA